MREKSEDFIVSVSDKALQIVVTVLIDVAKCSSNTTACSLE